MQKIQPCLWFDSNCEEAMNYYIDTFNRILETNNSKIISIARYEKGIETPGAQEMEGKILTGIFELENYKFLALDGGPYFKLNPSVSFMLNFDPSKMESAKEKLVALWDELSEGGKTLMPLQKYDFSELYGWVEDKYGISWQLILSEPEGDDRPFIIPSLLFVGENVGKAEEAIEYYVDTFRNSKLGQKAYYPAGMEFDKEGTLMFSDLMLEGVWFAAMDSGLMHDFTFSEAISFNVECTTQEEVDYYWEKLSAVPEAEQCGWLKDKYGISWQIVPRRLGELIEDEDREKAHRVANAMLQMKKIDIAKLEEVYNQQ